MVSFKISATGLKQLQSKTSQLAAFDQDSEIEKEVVRDGVKFGKRNVVVDTGALKNAIFGKYGRVNKGVYIKVPKHNDGRNRPYHLWRHGLGKFGKELQTEDAIMPKIIDYMQIISSDKFLKRLSKIINK